MPAPRQVRAVKAPHAVSIPSMPSVKVEY